MNRIVKFHVNDVLHSSNDVSEALNKACEHEEKMEIVGCFPIGENLLFTLEQNEDGMHPRYVLSQFPSENEEEIIAEISSRYFSGFSTLSAFKIAENTWGLFANKETLNKD